MERTGIIYQLSCTCGVKCHDKARYVGQTVNPDTRKRQHLSRKNTGIVGDWVHSHGSRHIKLTVLESDIPQPQLDERERHWVREMQTYEGDGLGGLNLTRGGQDAVTKTSGGVKAASCKLTLENAWDIREMYKDRSVTALHLSRKFGVKVGAINDVVRNKTWKDPDYTFVPRPRGGRISEASSTLTPETVQVIRQRAAATPVSELAREYGVANMTIRRVISGETWKDKGYTTQRANRSHITSLSLPLAREMRADYATGDYTYPLIAEKYKASISSVADVLTHRTFKEPA